MSGTLGASQVALVVKNPPANAGDIRDVGSIPGSGISPGGGHGNPLPYFCLENPHGQRSLAGGGASSWGCKESDTTEATKHRHMHRDTWGSYEKYIFLSLSSSTQ